MSTLLKLIVAAFPSTSLTRLSAANVEELRREYPGMPEDYLQVLRDVGYGTIGDGAFTIYSAPVSAESVLGDAVSESLGLVLVGDDMAGYHVGYLTDMDPWRFTEFDHCSPEDATPSNHRSLSSWLTDFVSDYAG